MMSRLLLLMAAVLLASGGLFAASVPASVAFAPVASSAPGKWSVNSQDTTDPINSNVGQACTYRVDVDAGSGTVNVIVRDRNGNEVKSKSGPVEAGNSRDFDLDQGFSIEVKYISQSSNGTYERL